jgi:hypothetical protein
VDDEQLAWACDPCQLSLRLGGRLVEMPCRRVVAVINKGAVKPEEEMRRGGERSVPGGQAHQGMYG